MAKEQNNGMRWFGAITLPWVVVVIALKAGQWMANNPPINDSPESGTDLLTLLGTGVAAGICFVLTIKSFAPSAVKKTAAVLTALLTIAAVSFMPYAMQDLGGIVVARMVCVVIGAWVAFGGSFRNEK